MLDRRWPSPNSDKKTCGMTEMKDGLREGFSPVFLDTGEQVQTPLHFLTLLFMIVPMVQVGVEEVGEWSAFPLGK